MSEHWFPVEKCNIDLRPGHPGQIKTKKKNYEWRCRFYDEIPEWVKSFNRAFGDTEDIKYEPVELIDIPGGLECRNYECIYHDFKQNN